VQKKFIFLTNYKDQIPQRNHEIEGLKLNIISEVLQNHGIEVQTMTIQSFISLLSKNECIRNVHFFYTSSQYPIYKSFIQDILYQIVLREGILVPGFRHFLAHENKNFQELEKFRLGIKSPHGIPVGTYEEGLEILENSTYPVVIKKSTGFRSRHVRIANNHSQGKKILYNLLSRNFKFDTDSLYYLYRRIINKTHYPVRFGKIIIQEYIPKLDCDWKILVLGSTCFCLKRYVRKNDFRASGSKLYSITDDPSTKLLDFAFSSKEKLNCPIVSLDIVEIDGILQLIEYQALHFGLLTATMSDSYYQLEKGNWEKRKVINEIEHYIGMGICEYIKKSEVKDNL
jgi:hypothetical protein